MPIRLLFSHILPGRSLRFSYLLVVELTGSEGADPAADYTRLAFIARTRYLWASIFLPHLRDLLSATRLAGTAIRLPPTKHHVH